MRGLTNLVQPYGSSYACRTSTPSTPPPATLLKVVMVCEGVVRPYAFPDRRRVSLC